MWLAAHPPCLLVRFSLASVGHVLVSCMLQASRAGASCTADALWMCGCRYAPCMRTEWACGDAQGVSLPLSVGVRSGSVARETAPLCENHERSGATIGRRGHWALSCVVTCVCTAHPGARCLHAGDHWLHCVRRGCCGASTAHAACAAHARCTRAAFTGRAGRAQL